MYFKLPGLQPLYQSPWVLKCRELEREVGRDVLGSGDAARSGGDFKLFFGPQYLRSPQLTSDSPGMMRVPCLCSQEQKDPFFQEVDSGVLPPSLGVLSHELNVRCGL